MAMDWTHAVMTFLQLAGESPICPVRQRSRVIALRPSFSRVAWWSLSVSCESSHTHFFTTMDVGRLVPAEEDAGSEGSPWERRERREWALGYKECGKSAFTINARSKCDFRMRF